MLRTDYTQHVIVNSNDLYGSPDNSNRPTNFQVPLRNAEFVHGNASAMIPIEISIPNLFNNVYEGYKDFVFYGGTVPSTWTIRMPTGRYSLDEYMTELQLQITTATAGDVTLDTYSVYKPTQKLTMTFNQQITFFGDCEASQLLGGLGTAIVGTVIELQGVIQMQGPQVVIVKFDNVTEANAVANLTGNETHFSLYDILSLHDVCYGATAFAKSHTSQLRRFTFKSSTDMSNVRFILLDQAGLELSLPINAQVFLHYLIGAHHSRKRFH